MMALVDFEHLALARVIEGAAALVHEPDGCDLCDRLDVARHLHGLADAIRAATDPPDEQPDPQPKADPPPKKINNTPHEHGPKPGKGGGK